MNIRKLGCHHRKEQKSSEKHLAIPHQIKFFSFRDGIDHLLYKYISELFFSFWSNSTIQIALSIYIYIYRQLEMKLSNSVIMLSINSPQFTIYLASQIHKAYVQSIYCSLTSAACLCIVCKIWYVFWLTCIDHEDHWVHYGVTETYLLVISSTPGLLLRSPGPSDGALSYLLIKESTVCIGVTAKTSQSLS